MFANKFIQYSNHHSANWYFCWCEQWWPKLHVAFWAATPKCCAVRQWCLVIGGYEPPDRKYLGSMGQTSRGRQVTTDHWPLWGQWKSMLNYSVFSSSFHFCEVQVLILSLVLTYGWHMLEGWRAIPDTPSPACKEPVNGLLHPPKPSLLLLLLHCKLVYLSTPKYQMKIVLELRQLCILLCEYRWSWGVASLLHV